MNWAENKSKFYFIIIIVLIVIVLLQKCGGGFFSKPNINISDTIRIVDTTYLVIISKVPTYIPQWKTRIKYIHDTTKIIDTVFVVGDYYSTYYYKDSLVNDTLKLYINDSISENKIKSRDLKYLINFPTITIKELVSKNEFYYGMSLVGSKDGINYFGPELMLRTKKKSIYGVGVGLDGNLKPNLSIRTYWKIGKK